MTSIFAYAARRRHVPDSRNVPLPRR